MATNLKMLSLFSGIGGIDLAAQWAGIETVAFCEIEKFCQQVLRKNFGQEIVIFDDVRELTRESLREKRVERVDIVAGGFPCQDVSGAGKRRGIDAPRSGLWREMFRIVCEIRPRFVLVENTEGLLERGMSRVLGDLAGVGFDAEWGMLSACATGAAHTRERVFVVAYPSECGSQSWNCIEQGRQILLDAHGETSPNTPNGNGFERQAWSPPDAVRWLINPTWRKRVLLYESKLCRNVHGLSARLDRHRNKALGNAVMPQQVYPILKAIADYEQHSLIDF